MSKKIKLILIIVCLIILILSGCLYYDYYNKKYEIIFLDVGQGDAILIDLPGNNEILIDGGPDINILEKLGKHLPIYNSDIELMILTHPHSDHVTGLIEVLKRYEIKK
jgi:competence protein ComEC